jgi:hypothetical protein
MIELHILISLTTIPFRISDFLFSHAVEVIFDMIDVYRSSLFLSNRKPTKTTKPKQNKTWK